MPFHGRFGDVGPVAQGNGRAVIAASRAFWDSNFTISATTDALLEGTPGGCLYRHAQTGIVCAADARVDSAPDLTAFSESDSLHGPAAIFAHAYLRFGADFLSRIRGDFCGVIWDPRHQRLLLFVDLVATHGVFYARSGAVTQFSTDLRSFTSTRIGTADFERLFAWTCDAFIGTLAGGGVSARVPPGHVAVIDRSSVTLHRYWSPADAPDVRFHKSEEYVDAAEGLLEDAVRCRLPRRLKPGCHLSGGLDCTIIAGTAAKILAKSGRTLTAFTFTHTDPDIPLAWHDRYWDEHRPAAAFAARFANIEHVQISTDAPGLFEGLDSFLASAGQPPLSALSVWAARHAVAAKAQSSGIGVMLTGIAGNQTVSQEGESLFSYLLRRGRLVSLLREGAALWRNSVPLEKLLARTFGPLLREDLQYRILGWAGIPQSPVLTDFIPFAKDVRSTLDKAEKANQLRWPTPRQVVERELANVPWSNVYAWYRQGFGIDMRSPFMDSRILDFCAGLPPDQLCNGGEGRHLARRLLRRLGAPDELVNETRRGIQYANWHSAMMRERPALYRNIAALEGNATASRLLDLAEMRLLVDALPSANPASRSDLRKFGNRLSIGLSIGRFVLHLEGSNAGPPLTDGDDWQTPPGSSIYN